MNELMPARLGRLATLKILHAPLSLRDQLAKRSIDIILSMLFIFLALPIFMIVAIAIKLDSRGPVLFRQRRNGFNQGEFKIYKFRTMTTLEDGLQFRQATRNDRRITRVGAFLRRTNLDELPQLLNVLLGHMSLVGPRPHAVAHNDAFEKKIQLYAKRHNVKPGITGWSQINGYRGETDTLEKMKNRVQCDIYYIDNWSVFFDLYILIKTVFSKKSYNNAY
jgi:exopolysaccharide biosynthesis polyprenyl glycosylphosphotransferase